MKNSKKQNKINCTALTVLWIKASMQFKIHSSVTVLHWSDNTANNLDVNPGLTLARESSKSPAKSKWQQTVYVFTWKDSGYKTITYQYEVCIDR